MREQVNPHRVTIAITGGEPLLWPDLETVGHELKRREFPWGIVTNGWALTAERFARLLDAGLHAITVSFDGHKEAHDWFRGRRGSYERARTALSLCARQPGLSFDVVTCVNQRNFGELESLRRELADLGVRRWRLLTVFPKGRAAGNDLLKLSPGQFRDLLDFIVDTRESGAMRASYGCEGFLGEYEGRARDSFFFCRAGINIGSVLVDGSISACPSLRGDYVQGNIYRDRFWHIWENRFTVMRDRRWTKSGACATCPVYAACQGSGVPALRTVPIMSLALSRYSLHHGLLTDFGDDQQRGCEAR
ncbi:MAG: radical SAM protein [Chitinivibrionales bacterium]|nr:radical SAM protein [Chitinivibrionales bacterium]